MKTKLHSLLLLAGTAFFGSTNAQSINFNWVKSIGGSSDESGYALTIDKVGNTLMTGFFKDSTDFDPGPNKNTLKAMGSYDVFMTKYNSTGNLIWAKAISGTSSEFGHCIKTDNQKNVYLAGVFRGTVDFDPSGNAYNLITDGSDDIFVAKYDSMGNFIWANRIGDDGSETVTGLEVDANGNTFISGSFTGTVDFDPSGNTLNIASGGVSDFYIAKYASNGSLVWAKGLGGTWDDYSKSMSKDDNDNLYITGTFNGTVDFNPAVAANSLTSSGGEDMFVAKYNSSGNYIWAIRLGYSDASIGDSRCIKVDKFGNFYLTGLIYGNCDFDPSANNHVLTAVNNQDAFIARYNSNGQLSWAYNLGNTGPEIGLSIAIDKKSNPYFTGTFQGKVDFDFSSDSSFLSSKGNIDIYILKYDSSGLFKSVLQLGGTEMEKCLSMAIDNYDQMRITGFYNGSVQFNSSQTLNSAGLSDIFLSQYCVYAPELSGSISGLTNICRNQVLKYSIPKNADAVTYTWTLPSGWQGSSDSNSISVTPGSNNGVIQIKASNTCGTSNTLNLNVSVNIVDATYTIHGNSVSANMANASYRWLDCKNGKQAIPGAQSQTFTPDSSGSYALEISKNGCVDTSDCFTFFNTEIPMVYSPAYIVQPNPSNGSFDISSGHTNEILKVKIINLSGQIIYCEEHKDTMVMHIETQLPPGIYFIEMTNQSEHTYIQKLIVQ